MPMPGLFNVENALAAAAAAEVYGLPREAVVDGLARAFVPGRMEHYRSADGQVDVIVDYAHNGMSLEALLRSARLEFPGRPITLLFGCTGGKGLDRRAGMGQAAGALADRIILTEDDPGPEEVTAICADIGRYIAPSGKGCEQQQKRKNGPEPCVPDGMLARRFLDQYNARSGRG